MTAFASSTAQATIPMSDLASHYLEEISRQLRGHKRMAEAAIAQLEDKDFFATLDPEGNSVAVIVKHMSGNARSRFTDFLTSDGEKPDRKRDQEFVMTAATSRDQLLGFWEQNWGLLFDTLNGLEAADLERTVTIRGEAHSVLQALNRAMGHCSYHVGQITFLAKHWKGAEWKTLSVPKGQSEQFNAKMAKKHGGRG